MRLTKPRAQQDRRTLPTADISARGLRRSGGLLQAPALRVVVGIPLPLAVDAARLYRSAMRRDEVELTNWRWVQSRRGSTHSPREGYRYAQVRKPHPRELAAMVPIGAGILGNIAILHQAGFRYNRFTEVGLETHAICWGTARSPLSSGRPSLVCSIVSSVFSSLAFSSGYSIGGLGTTRAVIAASVWSRGHR